MTSRQDNSSTLTLTCQMSETLPALPGEPPRWYARLCAYAALGPTRRLLAAYHQEGKQPEVPSTWLDMAERWDWRERVAVSDTLLREQETARLQAEEETRAAAEKARAEKAKDDRLLLLRAARSRLAEKLRDLTPTSPDWAACLKEIATLNEQFRREEQ